MAETPPAPPPSCTLVGVNMEDPAAAVRDPQLAALVRDGWQVVAHVPAQRGGRNEWLLLLTPPPQRDALPTVTMDRRTQLALLALCAVQLATLALLALYTLGGTS